MIMTQDKARKAATRQRMAETGEPYSVARHAVEREHEGATAEDPLSDRGAPPRDDRWYASEAEEAGISVAEFRVQHLADRADKARERAEEAEETVSVAREAAELAQQAADMTRGWADKQEQERAQRRADQARAAAEEARRRADQAQRQADEAGKPPTRRRIWLTKPATARTPGRIVVTATGTTMGPIRDVLTSPGVPPTGCKTGSVSSWAGSSCG
jgi:hypothetical protein